MSSADPSSQPARDALRRAVAALDLAETTGRPYAMSQALAQVARCHRELQSPMAAETHLIDAVRWARLTGSTDHVLDLLCELADTSARLALGLDQQEAGSGHAARERARDHAFEAVTLALRMTDPSCEAQLLMRVSAVLERCGDHAEALNLQSRALNRLSDGATADVHRMPGLGRMADS